MTETPEGHEPTQPLPPQQPGLPPVPPPPAWGQPGAPAGGYGQPGFSQPGHGQPAYGQPVYGQPAYGAHAGAPYGVDPMTGLPYSDKSKLVAGLLQLLIPLGIGRMYSGQVGLGVAQLVVTLLTCGIGGLWPFIDGIVILAGSPKDDKGRPLRS